MLLVAAPLGLALVLGIGAVVPVVLALGTHFPLYAIGLAPLPAAPLPAGAGAASCRSPAWRIAALVAVRGRAHRAASRWWPSWRSSLVAVDLRVARLPPVRADAATPPTQRCAAAARPPARAAGAASRASRYGSVYLYYDMQAAARAAGRLLDDGSEGGRDAWHVRLEPLSCGDWRPGTERVLGDLGVRYVALHRGGIEPATGLVRLARARRPRLGQSWPATADHDLRPRPPGRRAPHRSPSPDSGSSSARVDGRSPRYRHGAFWIRGGVRLTLTTRDPVRATLTVDRRPLRSLRVTGPVSATVGGAGWHLVGIDVVRADRGLRAEVTSP